MLTFLALVATANASDVATEKKFGIGVASGPMAISVTGKYYFSDKAGVSAYLGTSGLYTGLRANFEDEFVTFHEWDFGRLDMYWDAGLDVGLLSYYGVGGFELGVGGGVGVELQFEKVPASVFVDAGLGIWPLNGATYVDGFPGFGLVSPRGAAGGRWYF
jgi:hypothetical protein